MNKLILEYNELHAVISDYAHQTNRSMVELLTCIDEVETYVKLCDLSLDKFSVEEIIRDTLKIK